MRRGTTPTLELLLDTSLTGCEFWVTIESGCAEITKREADCTLSEDGKTVYCPLTQEDTLSLDPSQQARVQIRFKAGGGAYATNIATAYVDDILMDGAI